LFWSAVINGVIAVPFMAIMMLMVGRADVMGPFVATLAFEFPVAGNGRDGAPQYW
jgi:Mn2+/Fe2+ NRAMP family transporter